MSHTFWDRVSKSPTCWVWRGGLTMAGYGRFQRAGRSVYAHRASFEEAYGPIAGGLQVLHHCDNPPCVRPDHLFLGTQADNVADASRKGRMHPGEANGAARLRTDDVRVIRDSVGPRAALAERYGITRAYVTDIRARRVWGWLP